MRYLLVICLMVQSMIIAAQENVAPLMYKRVHQPAPLNNHAAQKSTALGLPFFEDFTDNSYYVNNQKWEATAQVYVNNTMGNFPRSRGVVTFDCIAANGLPYAEVQTVPSNYGDTLSSLAIDLSSYNANDSIYFSFLLQPQGNGFSPDPQDSLIVYFKNAGGFWVRQFAQQGSNLKPFTSVLIPVQQSMFFHDKFQFRFVNRITINTNDDIWNVDYIRLDANRSYNDTLLQDVAFTETPSNMLNDYTVMPFRHYLPFGNDVLSPSMYTYIQNNNTGSASVQSYFNAQAQPGGATLFNNNIGNTTISGNAIMTITSPTYTNNIAMPGWYDRVEYHNQFYFQTTSPNRTQQNDTVVGHQVFDNYLAYDDGSAERSYFLNLFPTLPGKIALEFNLPQSDTMKGVAIYFGRQYPLAYLKTFTLQVFKSIAIDGASDNMLYQETDYFPHYDSVDNFWYYPFSQDVPLTNGKFYVCVMQPAFSGSDSLYIGLDMNRVGSNHTFYNVLNVWEPSNESGALMIRPVLGKHQIPNSVKDTQFTESRVHLYPNPAKNELLLAGWEEDKNGSYKIYNTAGMLMQEGKISGDKILVHQLIIGNYLLQLTNSKGQTISKSFIKN